jgi:hypothetical protein
MTTGAFTVGGAVQASAGVYIERNADHVLLALCAAGSFAYVLAPRQVGKSSLMIHTVQRLKQRGVACVTIILTAKDVTADQWYRVLLIRIADQLHLRTDPQKWWAAHDHLSVSQRFKQFLQAVLPAEITQPVVIFIDEIELTLGLDFADDFFGTLRSLYDERATTPALERISFVLLGATSPGELVQQPTRAPFNIGHAVVMTDFTIGEAQQFAQVFNAPLEDSKRVIAYILDWTGGHPYLTQCLCAALVDHQESWDQDGIARLVRRTFLASSESHNSNLQEVQRTITKRAEDPYATLVTYRTVLRRGSLPDSAQSSAKAALKLSGIVQARDDRLVVRNQIYRSVFDKAWAREQLELLPNYLPRRIQQTFQYAAYVLLVPLIVLAVLAGFQWYRAERAAKEARDAATLASNAEIRARIARGMADNASTQADAQRKAAQSSTLALHAVARYNDDPEFSLKTLLSAAKRGWTPAVDQAMRQIMPPVCDDLNRRVYAVAWPSIGNPIVLVDSNAAMPVLNQALVVPPLPQARGRAAYMSDDGSAVLLPTGSDSAGVWNVRAKRAIVRLQGAVGEIERAVWSPDRRWIITIAKAMPARVWNAEDGRLLRDLADGGALVNRAAWSADSQRFATSANDGSVRVWSLDAGQPPTLLGEPIGGLHELAWRPDGAQIALADMEGTVRIWDTRKGAELRTFHAHDGPISALRWSHTMRYLLTIDSDMTVRVWEAASGAKISSLPPKPAQLPLAALWSPDDRDILIAGMDGMVCTYATREHMLESERLRNITPLSADEENRLFEELLPSPVATASPQPETPTPIETAYPPPTTSIPIPATNTPIVVPNNPGLMPDTLIPAVETNQPTAETDVPTAETNQPTAETSVPTAETSVPTAETSVPTAETSVPTAETSVPAATAIVPTVGTANAAQPAATNTSQSSDTPVSATPVPSSTPIP